MWNNGHNSAPNGQRLSKSAPCSPLKPLVKKVPARADSFHVMHKVPVGDTPYVKAKHVQLVDKDPDRAIALFWAAINANDRVDSALKDMAIVMKQQNRPEEAIEAIKSLRNRCSDQAQESLDNVLLDLYKRCGRLDDQIALLKHKLNLINQGLAFNGKRTKTARSQGKKFQVSIEQEATRLLGNLGWAYMQQCNYVAAEAVYRKALAIQPDNNKVCNLGICLMNQGRVSEAKSMLQSVEPASANGPWGLDSHLKSYERAQEMLREIESQSVNHGSLEENSSLQTVGAIVSPVWQSLPCPWKPIAWDQAANQNPNSDSLVSVATTFLATSGFGPTQQRSVQQKAALSALDANGDFSMFSSGLWEENTEEEGFGDENMNVNINNVPSYQNRAPFGFPQNRQTQQSHAEVLKQKLEKVCLNENNGNAKRSFLPHSCAHNEHVLNSAAPPFFSKNALQRDKEPFSPNGFLAIRNFEERVPLTFDKTNVRRMMSFGGNGILGPEGNGLTKKAAKADPIPVDPTVFGRGQRFVNENRPATRRSLSFESIDCGLDIPPLPKQQGTTLAKNNSASLPSEDNSADQWDSLGFIQCPDNKDFEQAIMSVPCESSNSDSQCWDNKALQQQKCQGRLRVFQEMTLPASPKA